MISANQSLTGLRTKRRKSGFLSYKAQKRLVPLLYVAPAGFLFTLLMLFPMLNVLRYSVMDGAIMKKNAAMKPSVGETTSGISTFWTSEPQRNAPTPACATTAPASPPTSA